MGRRRVIAEGRTAPRRANWNHRVHRTLAVAGSALLWGTAGAQTAPASAPPAVPVITPSSGEISERVKRDAERPMFWIRKHSDRGAGDKAADKTPDKPAERLADKAETKPADKSPERPADKTAEKTAVTRPAPRPAGAVPAPATAAPVAAAGAERPATPASAPRSEPEAPTTVAALPPAAPLVQPPSPAPAPAPAPVVDESPAAVALAPGQTLSLPDAVMRRWRRGMVEVKVDVAPDGSVTDATVVQSSNPRLEQPALQALKAARFQPVPRPTSAVILFDFDLDS